MADWLKPITRAWMAVIKKAIDCKRKDFSDDADEAMSFFDGPYDFLYETKKIGLEYSDAYAQPKFQMTFNKVAEAVQLFGPSLYHRNPYRQVNPARMPELPLVDPNDPQAQAYLQQMQQQRLAAGNRKETLANLLQYYLNYTPNELDLRGNSRQMVDEAIIKGMGVEWIAPYQPPGSPITLVGSFYDSIDNLVIDPDMESIEGAKWIARRRVFPKWEVERRFNLPPGTLKGNLESRTSQAQITTDPDYQDERARGETNDLFTYWEVYSRMGFGSRLRTSTMGNKSVIDDTLEEFGDHIFLAVCDEYPCPLNLPEEIAETVPIEEAFNRVQWPTPFWADPTDPWPFTYLSFHKRPRKVWPMSHIKPAMGELKFLNWAFSFCADKIKNTSRDFIGIVKSAGEEMKSAILSGKDLTLIEIESTHGKTISDVVSFLQHPNFNGDVYKIIDMMMGLLERRLGLNELMYGEQATADRSATVSQVKADHMKIRPDDMAECVEATHTKGARKEALAARWHLGPADVAPMLGPEMAQVWAQVVQDADPHEVVLELDYRIEAGSIRKPNRNREMDNANAALQQWGPFVQTYFGATGDVGPINALADFWCKAFDYPTEKLRFQPPPPPQPDPTKQMELQMKMQAEQQKAQLQMQSAQADLQLKQAEMQAKIAADAQSAQTDLQIKQVEGQQQMELTAAEGQQAIAMAGAGHHQEMVQDQQTFLLDLLQKRQAFALDMQQKEKEGELALKLAKQQAAVKPKASSNGSK